MGPDDTFDFGVHLPAVGRARQPAIARPPADPPPVRAGGRYRPPPEPIDGRMYRGNRRRGRVARHILGDRKKPRAVRREAAERRHAQPRREPNLPTAEITPRRHRRPRRLGGMLGRSGPAGRRPITVRDLILAAVATLCFTVLLVGVVLVVLLGG